jgi:hypothetical protein
MWVVVVSSNYARSDHIARKVADWIVVASFFWRRSRDRPGKNRRDVSSPGEKLRGCNVAEEKRVHSATYQESIQQAVVSYHTDAAAVLNEHCLALQPPFVVYSSLGEALRYNGMYARHPTSFNRLPSTKRHEPCHISHVTFSLSWECVYLEELTLALPRNRSNDHGPRSTSWNRSGCSGVWGESVELWFLCSHPIRLVLESHQYVPLDPNFTSITTHPKLTLQSPAWQSWQVRFASLYRTLFDNI